MHKAHLFEGIKVIAHSESPNQTVLCAHVAPHLEEFFRSERCTFDTWKVSREMMAMVCYVITLTVIHNKLTPYANSRWEELDKEDLAFARHGPMGCLGSRSRPQFSKISIGLTRRSPRPPRCAVCTRQDRLRIFPPLFPSTLTISQSILVLTARDSRFV